MTVIESFQKSLLILTTLAWIVNGLSELRGSDGFGQQIGFDNPDSAAIESLQNAGLYGLAIETCRSRQKLSGNGNSDATARWTILLMQSTVAKLANDSKNLEQSSLLTSGLQEVESIANEFHDSPRQPWLAWNVERCRWYVLQRTLAAYLAVPARQPLREWSLDSIRTGINKLEKLQIQIRSGPQRALSSPVVASSSSSAADWISLGNDVALLQADMLQLRAMFYPIKSTERIAAATEMLALIEKAQRSISASWSGRPMVELARCKALLLLDRSEEAIAEVTRMKRNLEQPSESNRKPDFRWIQRMAVVAAESNRQLQRLDDANSWIEQAGGWSKSPELAIEYFANLVAQTSSSSNATAVDPILQLKSEIGKRFGFHWQQRAEAILVSSSFATEIVSSSKPEGANKVKLELLLSEAKQFLAANRIQEAIDKLRQAEMSAANSQDDIHALDVSIRIAAIYSTNQQPELAQAEFHRAALQYSKANKAPEAAMMSIWQSDNASNSTPEHEATAERFSTIRQRLMDIVVTWPETPQAMEAFSRLDRMFLRADKLSDLLQLWRLRLQQCEDPKYGPLSKQKNDIHDRALSRYAIVCVWIQDAWLDRSMSTKELNLTNEALLELEQALSRTDATELGLMIKATCNAMREGDQWPKTVDWPRMPAVGVDASGGIPISRALLRLAGVDSLKTIDIKTSSDPIEEVAVAWARGNWIFIQLCQTKRADESKDSNRLRDLGMALEILKSIVESDSQWFSRCFTDQRIGLLREHLKLWEIGLHYGSGQESQGLELLKSIPPSQSKGVRWSYRIARLFQTVPTQRPLALNQYRTLAKGFSGGSDGWLEMRFRTFETLHAMGNDVEAIALSDLVLATYPSLSSEWKSRFSK